MYQGMNNNYSPHFHLIHLIMLCSVLLTSFHIFHIHGHIHGHAVTNLIYNNYDKLYKTLILL